jgi:3-hydroxyisobutyrate dehydrogenase-like beta-hydroxyacid dehydrogenase
MSTRADEAVLATPLAILCLSSTDDVRAVLDTVEPDRLAGQTVLNVTTGTPEDAHSLRDWAQAHGLRYLDGAIAAYPEQIGTQPARILVAGDEELWQAHQRAVCDLAGSSMYVGADHGAANVIDAAMTGAFYISSLVSFIEATRFVSGFGVSYEVLADLVGYSVGVLEGELQQILRRIAAGEFSTDEASLNVYADAAAAFAAGMSAQGDASMIQTTAGVLRQAVEAGLGDADIAAVFTLPPARAS